MYIFKYLKKENNELLGYHLDTFGQLGSKELAKRYGSKNSTSEQKQSQLETIKNNLKTRLNPKKDGIFYEAYKYQKETQYKNLNFEEIDIQIEDVNE